ncbi:MAG: iron-siderophore ABC transporter substrate-binding protein [Anaerolineae bacterium]|nr:iron-siderophore ABC transporter substrate-binding protein [Anaerolineae bacterium]
MLKRVLILIVLLGLTLPATTPVFSQETPTSAFPVTIKHEYGETTIDKAPERVVAIGYTEQDFLLALGVKPIAVRYWYGDAPNAIFPWAVEAADGAAPEVLNMPYGNLNYEAILALKPDFISAVTSGITQEEYETLSKIAPVLPQTADYINFGIPWQATTKLIGQAVGKSAEAQAIVERVEGLFKSAREENPEFVGKTVAVSYMAEPGKFGFYTDQDSRGRFFTDLGFVVPQELVDIAGKSFYADLSPEKVDLLDRDLIAILNLQFIEGGIKTLEAEPLFKRLKAVQERRVLYLEIEVENAVGFSSPLSLEFALNAVVPKLQTIFGK